MKVRRILVALLIAVVVLFLLFLLSPPVHGQPPFFSDLPNGSAVPFPCGSGHQP